MKMKSKKRKKFNAKKKVVSGKVLEKFAMKEIITDMREEKNESGTLVERG
mgnify:CR=1 FL=1